MDRGDSCASTDGLALKDNLLVTEVCCPPMRTREGEREDTWESGGGFKKGNPTSNSARVYNPALGEALFATKNRIFEDFRRDWIAAKGGKAQTE